MLEITVDGKSYKYDQTRLMNTEIKQIQKLFGISLADFGNIQGGNVEVIDALVWLVKTRDGEQVDPDALEYNLAGLNIRDLDAPAEVDAVDPSVPLSSDESQRTLDES